MKTHKMLFPLRFVTHGPTVQNIAARHGWLPGARYTNLRDVRHLPSVAFLDIDWRRYDFNTHLTLVKQIRRSVTLARDIESMFDCAAVIAEAWRVREYCG